MSRREQLNLYIERIQHRLRLGAAAQGALIIAAVALIATILIALLLNAYAFPEHSLTPARLILFGLIAAAIAFGLALPWLRLTRQSSIHRAETAFPSLEQRLVTFAEREQAREEANDPFIELLAADTLTLTEDAPPAHLVPQQRLVLFAAIATACAAVLIWLIASAPGHLGYGASLLWTGPKHNAAPLYQIKVAPGNVAVRRNADQLITAQIIGLDPAKVSLYARYQSASGFQPVAMQPQEGGTGYQFLFAGLPENVEYYVEAGPLHSPHFNVRVVDLPSVKGIQVTYHYPRWTGMQTVSEEHGGDLRALEGTDAELTIQMDNPLKDGMLVLDDGKPLHLSPTATPNTYRATIHLDKDGAYHVAALDHDQQVRLSEDYFISTSKASPPFIAIDRPGADYRASPIEEVTVGVKSSADFGLTHVALHYSVNGGPEKTVDLLKQPGAKSASNTATLNLEDFKMAPGDVISLYATAKDAHAESRTDISFIQADPFEREFSQSQQSGGGGGGGGGGAGNQTDISRREKELIAATWKQQNDKKATVQQNADMGKTLSEAQEKLREQSLALAGRMQSRDLSTANEEFNSFENDMQIAAKAMSPSADKLKAKAWQDALPQEQKALQALLRAEATFRKIQVAFGQQGGGGGGGGGSAGRDLASLFDLELDTEKNQYETAQTGSPAEEQAKKVDDALEKLDALAKRQEELAQQQGNKQQTFQQRWQQEMLRREAEQLQREMEQMQQAQQNQQGQSGQQSASNSSSQSGQQGQQGQQGQSGSQSGSQSSSQGGSQSSSQSASNSADSKDGNTDPRVQQALNHLRAANEAMRRAGGQPQPNNNQSGQQPGQQSAQQGTEAARRSAEQLREATSLLGGVQKRQATGKLDSLAHEATRIQQEEAAQDARIKSLATPQQGPPESITMDQITAARAKRDQLAKDRQQLSDDLTGLEKGLRGAAKELAPNQPGTSSKLRDALTEMDQSDLGNRVQRTADWLRRGINPESNGTESGIATSLKKLNDQVAQAQQSAGPGQPGNKEANDQSDTQVAALDRLDRLRSTLQNLNPNGQRGQQGQNGQGNRPGQNGQQQGQNGNQRGQQGQGQQQGQGNQQGQGQGQGNQQGQGSQQGQGQRGGTGQQAGGRPGIGGGNNQQSGDIGGNRNTQRGGGGNNGAVYGNLDTGNAGFDPNARHANAPTNTQNPADTQRTIRQGVDQLNQLRNIAKSDPAAERAIQDLIKEMQQLDPSRFPGNPAVVEQLHAQVLNDVDKLELQLTRANDAQPGQVRTSKPAAIPPAYQDAVAEYYRRLGKAQ